MSRRVTDPADPDRCQANFPHEQCWNHREKPSDFCVHHGGALAADEEAHRLYHLTEARSRQRLAQLSEQDQVQALRELIALTRRLVEKRFNAAKENADIEDACGHINTLELTVERLVKSANLIEKNLGTLLSKSQLFKLGQFIIKIASEELQSLPDHDQVVDAISSRVLKVIAGASNTGLAPVIKLPVSTKPFFLIENTEDQERITYLSQHERLKSLNEDIGLQAMMIEKRWNLIKNDYEMLSAVPTLNAMIRTLEKQIKSAHLIEQTLGQLLDTETVQRIGSQISNILVEELRHIDGFEQYTDQIMERVETSVSRPALPAPK